ncbi:MAG: metallophosphoesterase [Bacteroides sp.]|nr:metallophosphoesterase [Bacteroides sp.]MCM1477660.1 metallophosphoesterase [Bacteroides sp.]
MRIPLIPVMVMAVFIVAIDFYIYVAAKKRYASAMPSKIQFWSALVLYFGLIVTLCMPRKSGDDGTLVSIMWMLFTFISIYASKLIFVVVDCIASIPLLFKRRHLSWLSVTGGVLSVITFLAMWWGALINRFRVQVNEVEIPVENLPAAFDGYKIVQISDLHTGTYGADTTFLSNLVGKVNSMNGDLIVFTGDIVNRHSHELLPHISPLSQLDAPDGVISIMGNHDYGDYASWDSPEEKVADIRALADMQASMGWRLLKNETEFIYHNGDSIAIIGVENVGDPPFTVYGSLSKSYPTLNDSVTKILLTHNPAHWSMDIADHEDVNIALTLSGHTHAMQMEVLGLSPAAFRYKNWGGLYYDSKNTHPLYVNIGAGTVGLPMRLGATPEITVLTLKKAK